MPAETLSDGKKRKSKKNRLRVRRVVHVPLREVSGICLRRGGNNHVGNVDLFPDSTLLIQKAEVDWAFADGKPAPFKRDRPMKLLTGDLDVFGDGSATLLSTPGAYAGPSIVFDPPR